MRPHLATLAAQTGETIHLARLDGADIVYLDKFDSPLPVAAYSRIGGRAPACCVASGKALLAAALPSIAELRARFGTPEGAHAEQHHRLHGVARELERTAARGYAENREEWRLGVCGLGAPIFDARGEPVLAVGMSVPSIRFARSAGAGVREQPADVRARCERGARLSRRDRPDRSIRRHDPQALNRIRSTTTQETR